MEALPPRACPLPSPRAPAWACSASLTHLKNRGAASRFRVREAARGKRERLAFGGADEGVDGLGHEGLAVGREPFNLPHAAGHFQAGLAGTITLGLGKE